MFMLRRLVFTLFVFLFFLLPGVVQAQEQFFIDVEATYDVQETGITKVIHRVTLENAFSTLYAKSYVLRLENINPINPTAYEGQKKLPLNFKKEENNTLLEVTFDDALVGKGKSRTFSVEFEEDDFATRTGEVWEISIPRLSEENSFRSYTVNLIIPKSFGNRAYISPEPLRVISDPQKDFYQFTKEMVQKSGITAGFGEFQVFSFSLIYHLENPLNKRAETQIAIPPDTAFQKVYYDSIEPQPTNVKKDEDGNWLAVFLLEPRQRIDVTVTGSVQIFASPRKLPGAKIPSSTDLASTEYWQTDNPQIKRLATILKTPKAIYEYVVNNLIYDYERVRPNVERLGAVKALQNPSNAICMEFTDLFIALARSAGIPAREINGYAYTENPEIQPLSLVADVLHAWPEYWDEEKSAWIPVDPTWGSTTGGADYFTKLDLRHFTFVIHSKDPQKPYPPGSYKLGPNPQKDVYVKFGQLPQERRVSPKIFAEVKTLIPFLGQKISIKIKNPGPTALYESNLSIFFDGQKVNNFPISFLPPYAETNTEISIPFSLLGRKTPQKVTISIAGSTIDVPTNKTRVIIYNLLIIFLASSLVVLVVVFKVGRINIRSLTSSIKLRFRALLKIANVLGKAKEDQNI